MLVEGDGQRHCVDMHGVKVLGMGKHDGQRRWRICRVKVLGEGFG